MSIIRWSTERIFEDLTLGVSQMDVTALADGGYVIAYAGTNPDTGGNEMRVQRFNATGQPVGDEIVFFPGLGNSFAEPRLTELVAGGFGFALVFTETVGGNANQAAYIFDVNGVPGVKRTLDNGIQGETAPNVDRVVLGFVSVHTDAANDDVVIQVFGADGTGATSQVNVSNLAGIQRDANVATIAGAGRIAVTWVDSANTDIMLRIYSSSLTSPTAAITVADTAMDSPPAIAAIGNNRVVVAWHVSNGFNSFDVFFRIYDSTGTLVTGTTLAHPVQAGLQARAQITATSDGGFIMTWDDQANGNRYISARKFDASGVAEGATVRLTSGGSGSASDMRLDVLSDGRIAAVWRQDNALRHQIFDPRDGIIDGTVVANTIYGNSMMNDQISGHEGNDVLFGLNGNDGLFGGVGQDSLFGGAGDDSLHGEDGFDVLVGGRGEDVHFGGTGSDMASYADSKVGIVVSLAAPAQNTGIAIGDLYSSIEGLIGSAFNDRLTGNGQANTLNGGAGDDSLLGGNGNDTLIGEDGNDTLLGGNNDDGLYGGIGNDRLDGGAGNDTLEGAAGADVLIGGAGIDTASYLGAASGVVVALTAPAQNTGDAAGDTFSGIEGILGSTMNDVLRGSAGSDTLDGSQGNDVLSGLGGLDTLTGGIGADNFVFTAALSAANRATITDFNAAEDRLRLDDLVFTRFSPGAVAAANLLINATGQAQDANDFLIYNSSDGALFYDSNGSIAGGSTQIAQLSPGLALTTANFLII